MAFISESSLAGGAVDVVYALLTKKVADWIATQYGSPWTPNPNPPAIP